MVEHSLGLPPQPISVRAQSMSEDECRQEMLRVFLDAGEPLERAQELVEKMGPDDRGKGKR